MKTCVDCNTEKELNSTNFTKTRLNKKTGTQYFQKLCKCCYNSKQQSYIAFRYNGSKHSAIRRGKQYELTKDNYDTITTNQKCVYCDRQDGTEKYGYYVGVDRVDNEVGYKIGNVVPCCGGCNSMKGSLTYYQFIEWCGRIFKKHNHRF